MTLRNLSAEEIEAELTALQVEKERRAGLQKKLEQLQEFAQKIGLEPLDVALTYQSYLPQPEVKKKAKKAAKTANTATIIVVYKYKNSKDEDKEFNYRAGQKGPNPFTLAITEKRLTKALALKCAQTDAGKEYVNSLFIAD